MGFTPRNTMCLLGAGAGLALCFQVGHAQAGYKHGTFYVHKKAVRISKVGQTCCDPTVTFYKLSWGGTNQGMVHFPCAHPRAIVAGAEPSARRPNDIHRGHAYLYGCGVVKKHRLRD